MDKLTKRQRMAYLQKQNPVAKQQQQVQIGRLNKSMQSEILAKYLDPNVNTDMVFYELANQKNYTNRYEEFEEEDDDEELLAGLPRRKKAKNNPNTAQTDEFKRQQLEKILQE